MTVSRSIETQNEGSHSRLAAMGLSALGVVFGDIGTMVAPDSTRFSLRSISD